METKTINIFRFSELSEESKECASQNYAELFGYAWDDDAMKSIKALAEHFGGKMTRWSIDFFNSSPSQASFNMPELTRQEMVEKLDELGEYSKKTGRGVGECVLTGYCADEDAIDGFRKEFQLIGMSGRESILDECMQSAFESWLKACQDDCNGFYADESFSEHCDSNDYWFLEDGSITKES